MALTKTINYTQNVPISCGFNNELTGTATDIRNVYIDLLTPGSDSKMGQFTWTDVDGVSVMSSTQGNDPTIIQNIRIRGELSKVNTLLNSMYFVNHYYEADNLEQDFLSQDRIYPSDRRGEVMIQIPENTVHGLTVGSVCRISNSGRYVVTDVDDTTSPKRLWMVFRGDYELNDLYYGSPYKNPQITKDTAGNTITSSGTVTKSYTTTNAYLQTEASVNICPINDLAYCNPHGDFTIGITVYAADNTTLLDSGTLTFNGSFFIAEPYFTTLPTNVSAPTPENTYRVGPSMGAIAQVDNNYQSLQVLFKYCENDPNYLNVTNYTQLSGYPSAGTDEEKLEFIGNAINAKASLDIPTYITGTAVGNLGITQVGDRTSIAPTTGIIRWYFYGTPDECNDALNRIYYFRPAGIIKDFNYEVRIVNGRTRIYSSRGK